MNDRDIDIVTSPTVLPFRPLGPQVPDDLLEVVPGLLETLVEDGWRHGWPQHVTQETQQFDLRLCREWQYGQCGTVGLTAWPLHQGERYKLIGQCDACGTEAEL
jgi:hypothetical protein